jgi:pyruvate,water dikinase
MAVDTLEPTATFPEAWNASVPPGPPFTFDAMHFPFPISPLYATHSRGSGFVTALQEFKIPILADESLIRNHYRFGRMIMAEPSSPEEAAALFAPSEQALQAEVGRLFERWEGEHLPAVRERLTQLAALDPALDELPHALEEATAISYDLWTIHFRIVVPMTLAMQVFDEFHVDLFGGADTDGHALLVGVHSESIKSGIGLSDLALAARQLGLAPLFLETAPGELMAALECAEGGPEFLDRLSAWLAEHGYRQDLFDFAVPTWIEEPSYALAAIRGYVETGRDLRRDFEEMVQSASLAQAAARDRLAAYPEAVRDQFEVLMQAARHAMFLQEEHNFYIDQRGGAHLRLFFLRVGQRLVEAGLIDQPDDVMMLTLDELEEIAADPNRPALPRVLLAKVATCRRELAEARAMTPPPFLGDIPPTPPPLDNPLGRGMVRFWGVPPEPSGHPGELRGMAGSRGVASGRARVARTLQEAGSLQPGEILVAITTMPPWTPLFGVAAAVVTESGGPLSHCAIVAREYGIPAVVGAPDATSRITTGQRITVDGSSGVVTIDA